MPKVPSVETWTPDDPTAPEPAPERTGAERYTLRRPLGRGGNADVYDAHDTALDRDIALKVLRGTRRDRFLEEARLTARLEHPGIVPVHDVGSTGDGQPFFAMKRVRGRSLRELLEAGDLGSLRARIEIVRRVCEAVAFAHAHGVVHLDLKPENVMVGAFGEVLVMDWGLARAPDRPGQAAQRRIAGTPAYMAPEQALGEPVDERADVYALGALLYELLTERPAFSGTVEDVLEAVRAGRFAAPAGLPRSLEQVVLRAMAHAPEQRFSSVEVLIDELEAYLDQRPLQTVRYSTAERLELWAHRNQRPLAAGVGVAVAALVTIAGVAAVSWLKVDQERLQALAALGTSRMANADVRLAEGDVAGAVSTYRQARRTLAGAGADVRPADLALAEAVHDGLPLDLALARPAVSLVASPDGRRVVWTDGQDVHEIALDDPSRRRSAPLPGTTVGWAGDVAVGAWQEGDLVVVEDLDGRRVLEVEASGTIRLARDALWVGDDPPRAWSLSDGQPVPLAPPPGHWSPLRHGRYLVEATPDYTTRVVTWDGEAKAILPGRLPLAIDEDQLLFGQSDVSLAPLLEPRATIWRADDVVASQEVGFTSDGQSVWTLGQDGSIRLLDRATGERVRDLQSAPDTFSVPQVPSASGPVLTARREGGLQLHPAAVPPIGIDGIVRGLAFAQGGRLLLASTENGERSAVSVVDVRSRRVVATIAPCAQGLRGLAVAGDGRRAAAAGRDGQLRVIDLQTLEVAVWPVDEKRLLSVGWAGDSVLTAGTSGRVHRLDPRTGQLLEAVPVTSGPIWDLEVLDDAVVVGGYHGQDPVVALRRPGLQVAETTPLDEMRYGIAVSEDGRVRAAGIGDGVLLWGAGGPPRRVDTLFGTTFDVALTGPEPLLWTVGFDRRLGVFDASDPDAPVLLRKIALLDASLTALAVSPDGRWVAVGSSEGAIEILDLDGFARFDAAEAALNGSSDPVVLARALADVGLWEGALARLDEVGPTADPELRLLALLALGRDAEARRLARAFPPDHPAAGWAAVLSRWP